MTEELLPLSYPRQRAIPRATRPTVEQFRAVWQRARTPVVLTGVTDDWVARRWTPEDLRTRFGAHQVGAYVLRAGRIQLDPDKGFLLEHMPLARYVAATEAAQQASGTETPAEVCWYLRCALGALPPALANEVGPLPYTSDGLTERRNLWFAAVGTITHLHFDLPFNLVAQLYGRKRFVLFDPSDRPKLYPHSWFSSTPHLSHVDAERPDFARFPLLREAQAWETVLEPGDVLFLPPRWWHYARSLTTCLSVNTWWADAAIYPFMAASDAYKRLRGLNI